MLDAAAESAPDWISAHDAHERVYERNRDPNAAIAIAKRAHSGLVRARANLFVRECFDSRGDRNEIRQNNADLPSEFWWANGESALEQDWEAGDFATWIDAKFKWQAFGVKFDRSDIEAMLTPPSRDPESSAIKHARSESRPRSPVRSRKLTHDHPYVAAKTFLELMNLPEAERGCLNGPSVGRTMRDYYEQTGNRPPHDDNLDDYGESVLRALKEHWAG